MGLLQSMNKSDARGLSPQAQEERRPQALRPRRRYLMGRTLSLSQE